MPTRGVAVLLMTVALVVVASPSPGTSSTKSEAGAFYRLRVITRDGRHVRTVFKSPFLDEPTSEWSFADLSPDRKKALMYRYLGSTSSLYLTDVHGRRQRAVMSTSSFNPAGAWSPDGLRFSYETSDGGSCGAFTLWTAAADGSDSRAVGHGHFIYWGADHRSYAIEEGCLALEPKPTHPDRLVFVDASGAAHLIANGWAVHVVTSPRGGRLAYETYADDGRPTLHIARTDGSGEIGSITGASSAAWSPNGRRIAFVKVSGNPTWAGSIGVANADGSNVRIVARPRGKAGRLLLLEAPSWSPDGRRIAFSGENRHLETVRPNGVGRFMVVRRSVFHFWWSPSGRQIYYDGCDC